MTAANEHLARMTSKTESPILQGHKLLILSPQPVNPKSVESLRTKFPDLNIVVRQQGFYVTDPYAEVSEQEWKDVTVALTGSALPPLDAAPKLRLVQLCSAGVNQMAHHPFFKETDIPFCTAGGVAG